MAQFRPDPSPGSAGVNWRTGVDQAQREELIHFARRMLSDGLVEGMSGNLSVRIGDTVWITPSGVPYPQMTASDVCLVSAGSAEASGACGGGRRPSSETPMHLGVYQTTDAAAVVHTHSMFVVALSAVLDVLPAVHYAMADLGGPVRVVPYARFGTQRLADVVVTGLAGRAAVILRNHGAIAYGKTLSQAFERARTLEWLARAYWHARTIGMPSTLTPGQLDEVATAARSLRYGEPGPPR